MVLKLVNDAKVQTRILYTKVALWVDYHHHHHHHHHFIKIQI